MVAISHCIPVCVFRSNDAAGWEGKRSFFSYPFEAASNIKEVYNFILANKYFIALGD